MKHKHKQIGLAVLHGFWSVWECDNNYLMLLLFLKYCLFKNILKYLFFIF